MAEPDDPRASAKASLLPTTLISHAHILTEGSCPILFSRALRMQAAAEGSQGLFHIDKFDGCF